MNAAWTTASLEKLEIIFRDVFLDDRIVITEKTSPADIDEWDSLAHINLLSTVEKAFNVHFSAEDIGDIVDISTLLATLKRKSLINDH